VSDGVIYLATETGTMLAVDATTRAIDWIFETDAAAGSSPVVADGMVFLGTGRSYHEAAEGYIYAIGDQERE
jgi:outer membrane protein assembly factor BamB